LQCGVFNQSNTDYYRTDAGGHLDLIDASKYLVLAVNFGELLAPEQNVELQQNQFKRPFENGVAV
jgi:hypothetical protein